MKTPHGASRAAIVVVASAILTGCSSSSSGSIPNAPLVPGAGTSLHESSGKLKAEMRVLIPAAPRRVRGRQLRPYFVATSTQGIQVVVYTHGSHVTPLSTTKVGVGPSSPLCHAVPGGRSCTFGASAPAGDDDFVVTSYDAQPVNGSFAAAKQLAIGATTFSVVKGHANAIGLTLGGVVAKGAVMLATPSIPVIDHNSQQVTVSALDADGNTIVGDGWFDAGGSPVSMTLSVSNTSPVAIGLVPTNMTFAAHTSTLTYDSSTASSAQVKTGFTATLTATPSDSATAGQTVLTLAKPAFIEFPIPAMNSSPNGIVVGPDHAIWFAESLGNNIGRIATNAAAGTPATEFSGLTSMASPRWLANGADGNIWFTEFGIGKVASINPTTHAVNEYMTPGGMASLPFGIAAGPDGNLWFTESCASVSKIGRFNPSDAAGTMTDFPTHTAMSGPNMIAAGPDNNLWFTEVGYPTNAIGKMTVTGTASDYEVMPAGSIYQGGIAAGPDGALWFSQCNNNGNSVGRIATGGSPISQFALGTPASNPIGLVTGPDGAVWFTENGPDPANAIGRIDPVTHAIDEFTIPTSNSSPFAITLGPDGALWFTECDGNKIGRLR